MKFPERGTKGFTLIELLIVIAILGVLAAVVIPNVVGLMGRGGEQSYETDEKNLQLAVSTFYSDTHAGFACNGGCFTRTTNAWGCQCTEAYADQLGGTALQLAEDPGHYYPTAIGHPYYHVLELDTDPITGPDPDNEQFQAFRVMDGNETPPVAATDSDIQNHAIWMGLLYNEGDATDCIYCDGGAACGGVEGDCDGTDCGSNNDRWNVSSLAFEGALYIQDFPDSAMATNTYNGNPGTGAGGGYAWIVGDRGTVYGCYQKAPGEWYAGFSGAYP